MATSICLTLMYKCCKHCYKKGKKKLKERDEDADHLMGNCSRAPCNCIVQKQPTYKTFSNCDTCRQCTKTADCNGKQHSCQKASGPQQHGCQKMASNPQQHSCQNTSVPRQNSCQNASIPQQHSCQNTTSVPQQQAVPVPNQAFQLPFAPQFYDSGLPSAPPVPGN